MLKKLLTNTKLLNEVKTFYDKNKEEIVDILLYGSVVRGSENPQDIDIIILFKKEENIEGSYVLRKKLENIIKKEIHLITKKFSDFTDENFKARSNVFSQGISLLNLKHYCSLFGLKSKFLIIYNLKNLNKSKRMGFYYSLYGRNKQKGMVERLYLNKISDNLLLVQIDKYEETRDYLKQWNIEYKEEIFLTDLNSDI